MNRTGNWSGQRTRKATREPDIHRTTPHDANAEKAVLSSIMLFHGEAISKCVEAGVRSEWFFVPAHQTIFQDLWDVYESNNKIELIAFTNRLREKGLLEAIGGAAAVTDIALFVDKLHNYAPTIADLPERIELLRAAYIRREIIAGSALAAQRAYDPDPNANMDAVLDEIASRAASLRSLGNNGAIQIEDAATEIAKPIITPPDVIEGVLHRGGKASFGGASKSKKTWLLLDLAISVASGAPWFAGFPTHKGKVLYVNFELPKAFCWKRIRAICDERQITLEPPMLTVWNLRGRVRDWPRLQRQIRPGEFDLIIIDPVYKLLLLVGESLRDEIRTGGVATVLDQLDSLTVRTGAAIAFGAHFSKGDQSKKEAIDRVSGSGVWARDPDTIVTFTELKKEDCYGVEMTLRNHPPQEPFSVRWEHPVFIRADELDPKDLKQPKGAAEKQYTILDDLIPLLSAPLTPPQLKKKACARMSPATFYRLQKEAWKANAIIETKNGKIKVNPERKPSG